MKKIIFVIIVAALLNACATVQKVEITQPNFNAGKMKVGESYVAPMDGWFVSDEGIEKLLGAIEYFRQKWLGCERGIVR